eukprot:999441_1
MQVDDVTEKKKKHKLGDIYINTFKWFLNEILINTDVMANHGCQINNTNDSDTDKQYMIYIPAITNDQAKQNCYITIYSETHYTISNLTPTAEEILEMQQLSKADLTCQDTHCKYKIKIVNI